MAPAICVCVGRWNIGSTLRTLLSVIGRSPLIHNRRAGVTNDFLANCTGTWLLVAGRGGFQYADSPAPFCNDPSGVRFNATGGTDDGYTWFTNGANHWHNEYYWLDGEVTLLTQEGQVQYNIAVQTSGEIGGLAACSAAVVISYSLTQKCRL